MTRILVIAALLAGCAADGPAAPTWLDDVQPILMANCVRCHGANPNNGAPVTFRLDRYADHQLPTFQPIRGAATMARFVNARVQDGTMPPDWPVTDRQKKIIQHWFDQQDAATLTPPLGTTPAGHAPTVQLTIDDATPDQSAVVSWVIADDLDHEVVGTVTDDQGNVVASDLHTGTGSFVLDAGVLTAGPHTLTASIFDDVADELGTPITSTLDLTVAVHPNDDTAPRVTFSVPSSYPDAVFDDVTPGRVVYGATDPDPNANLIGSLEALRDDTQITIAGSLGVDGTTNTGTFLWNTRDVPAGTAWRLRLTFRDGTTERTATSSRFIVAHDTTTDTWNTTIGPLFQTYCTMCHSDTPPVRGIPSWMQYTTVYAFRGFIYRRLEKQEMPPISASESGIPNAPHAPLDDVTRNQIMTWIRAGAPQ